MCTCVCERRAALAPTQMTARLCSRSMDVTQTQWQIENVTTEMPWALHARAHNPNLKQPRSMMLSFHTYSVLTAKSVHLFRHFE